MHLIERTPPYRQALDELVMIEAPQVIRMPDVIVLLDRGFAELGPCRKILVRHRSITHIDVRKPRHIRPMLEQRPRHGRRALLSCPVVNILKQVIVQGFHVVVIELAKNRSNLELSCALLSMNPLNNRQRQLRIKTVRIFPIRGDLVAQDIRAWNQVVIP